MDELQDILDALELKESPCPIYFTKKNLRFYEMGAFFQEGSLSWIEINPSKFFSFLGYDRKKVLLHELIHAMRSGFEDSDYEEMIAYSVSKYPYQRMLGPFLSEKKGKCALFLVPSAILITESLQAYYAPIISLACLMSGVIFGSYLRKYSFFKKLFNLLGLEKIIKLSPQELVILSKNLKQDF